MENIKLWNGYSQTPQRIAGKQTGRNLEKEDGI